MNLGSASQVSHGARQSSDKPFRINQLVAEAENNLAKSMRCSVENGPDWACTRARTDGRFNRAART
jgi:hypothetical protein